MRTNVIIVALILVSLSTLNAQTVSRQNIFIDSQAEIDHFATDHPGVTVVQGNLEITVADDISDLLGLHMLTAIEGDLIINGYPYTNSQLSDLDGLNNITSIDGDLEITNSNSITSLYGLHNLISIGEDLDIRSCFELMDLSGLQSISNIGSDLWVYYCPVLNDLSGLENLISMHGNINIAHNDSLTSLQGLDNLNYLGIHNIGIHDNPLLTNCSINPICDFLSAPHGVVYIFNNAPACDNPSKIARSCGFEINCLPHGAYMLTTQASIDSFQYFYPGCHHLMGTVRIEGSDINNLDGLDSIISIQSYLEILNCNSLTNLQGLTQLKQVQNLGINKNSQLISLDGLDSLKYVEDRIGIHNNNQLSNIEGIANVDTTLLEGIIINNNPNLQECDVLSVCNYLSIPESYTDIWSNGVGCNSSVEVEEACAIGINNIEEQALSIYPNPSSDIVNIEGYLPARISVINALGQKVLEIKNPQQIDISNLENGIYMLRIFDKHQNQIATKKIVKQ